MPGSLAGADTKVSGATSRPNGVQLGIGLTCPSPELAQVCAHGGFDVVMIDMEHGPISIETAYRMVTAIRVAGVEAWIRVASNDTTAIKLALDAGAHHIIVPMVTTREEARQAVAASKYPPQGIRGWGPFRAQYQWLTDMADYSRRANAETRLSVLIEHPRALENLDAILEVEGLDGAIAVPLDLAANLGLAGQPWHPQVQEAIALAQRKIVAKGFPLITFSVSPEQGSAAIARGAKMLFLGFDTMLIPAFVQTYIAALADAR